MGISFWQKINNNKVVGLGIAAGLCEAALGSVRWNAGGNPLPPVRFTVMSDPSGLCDLDIKRVWLCTASALVFSLTSPNEAASRRILFFPFSLPNTFQTTRLRSLGFLR